MEPERRPPANGPAPVTEEGYRPYVSPFVAGLRSRCPRCGEGRLYQGLLTLRPRCESCGLDLRKADSGDGPAVVLIFVLGFTMVPLAILLEVLAEPPLWLHAVLWGFVILGGALLLLRPTKALFIALQYRNRASDSGVERYD